MKAFRIVVFDFDGTLVDSNSIKRNAFLQLSRRHPGGYKVMSRVLATVSGDRRAMLAAYLAEQNKNGISLPSEVLQMLVEDYSEIADTAVATAPEMSGASALLACLRQAGRQLALSSATPLDNLVGILARRGWSGWFDRVAGDPSTKIDTLREILATHALRPADVAVVGDGADDRASAAAIGCTFFPVGEARGADGPERVYTLPELQGVLAEPPLSHTA